MRRLLWPVLGLLALAFAGGWIYGAASHSGAEDGPASTRPSRPERQAPASSAAHTKPLAKPGEIPPASSAAPPPLAGLVVSVDPGHNGANGPHPEEINRPVVAYADGQTKPCNTTGTETDDGSLTEAAFNFALAGVLRQRLRQLGARVVMTRTDNGGVGPCVDERAEIANRAHADVAISIHADGNLTPGARGFDVIRPAPDELVDPSIAVPSARFAANLRDALVASGAPVANYVGRNGLDARDDLGGLNLSRVPVAMVELGNMRSAADARRLSSPAYRSRLATGLAAGIVALLSMPSPSRTARPLP